MIRITKTVFSGFVFRYYLATFLSGLMFYVSVLVPFYTEWGHLSLAQVQTLQSWLMIWMFLLNVPTGAIADRIGRKISISLGGSVLALSCVVYVLAPGFYPFLVAEFLAALGTSFVVGAGSALVYDYLKRNGRESESKRVLARSSAISNLGTMLAAPIGSIIAANLGIRAPMLLSAIPLFVASLIILTVDEPKQTRERRAREVAKAGMQGISFFLRNKKLQYLVLNDILVWMGAYFLIWLYQPTLIKVGLAIAYFGFIRAAFSLASMGATYNIHWTEKLFGSPSKFINFTAVIVSACLLLIAAFPNAITVVVGIILIGGLASARSSYINTSINEYIPEEQRATVLSVGATINTLAFALANPAVGYIADQSLRLAFLGVGALPLISFFLLPYRLRTVEMKMVESEVHPSPTPTVGLTEGKKT